MRRLALLAALWLAGCVPPPPEELPPDITIVPNTDGLTGGIRLWHEHPESAVAIEPPPGAPDQISATPT